MENKTLLNSYNINGFIYNIYVNMNFLTQLSTNEVLYIGDMFVECKPLTSPFVLHCDAEIKRWEVATEYKICEIAVNFILHHISITNTIIGEYDEIMGNSSKMIDELLARLHVFYYEAYKDAERYPEKEHDVSLSACIYLMNLYQYYTDKMKPEQNAATLVNIYERLKYIIEPIMAKYDTAKKELFTRYISIMQIHKDFTDKLQIESEDKNK